ncbi:hypothetical protein BJV78DRAFT_1155491 [Lactifluus subvellereus]|nr:hypothetical protein BJV78DRAFT_1155491 [Lactifluus subvellereus]
MGPDSAVDPDPVRHPISPRHTIDHAATGHPGDTPTPAAHDPGSDMPGISKLPTSAVGPRGVPVHQQQRKRSASLKGISSGSMFGNVGASRAPADRIQRLRAWGLGNSVVSTGLLVQPGFVVATPIAAATILSWCRPLRGSKLMDTGANGVLGLPGGWGSLGMTGGINRPHHNGVWSGASMDLGLGSADLSILTSGADLEGGREGGGGCMNGVEMPPSSSGGTMLDTF